MAAARAARARTCSRALARKPALASTLPAPRGPARLPARRRARRQRRAAARAARSRRRRPGGGPVRLAGDPARPQGASAAARHSLDAARGAVGAAPLSRLGGDLHLPGHAPARRVAANLVLQVLHDTTRELRRSSQIRSKNSRSRPVIPARTWPLREANRVRAAAAQVGACCGDGRRHSQTRRSADPAHPAPRRRVAPPRAQRAASPTRPC